MIKQSEYVYIIDDKTNEKHKEGSVLCYRDKDRCNRLIFEYPSEWRTSSIRERVIGFRSLFISKEYRHLEFDLDIKEIVNDPASQECVEKEHTGIRIKSWISEEHDLRKLWYDIRKCIEKYMKKNSIDFDIDNLQMDFDYKNNTFNNVLKSFDKNITLRVHNLNDDAKNVLNCFEDSMEYSQEIRFQNIWNRKDCCLKASFSISNANNYLAYSNKSYFPIKYYKINCSEPYFYIDLFHSYNHEIPVNLPADNRDNIVLGIVIQEQK